MKKYVMVGCGYRGIHSYAVPLVKKYADCATLCGVYDINRKRAELVSKFTEKNIPVFDDFDEMLKTVKSDTVIVTTKDSAHDYYIVKALYAGCDVISEKPLTTTFEKSLTIKKAQEDTGKKVTVTFNLRFHPFFKQAKELIASGVLGDILSVNYEWMLDVHHGSDYFRRWHRQRENSGSLLVHKSTHHFDIANWFLEQDPVEVNAFGTRRYYGPIREQRSERCLDCHYKDSCEYYFDIMQPKEKEIYYDCEKEDNYFRDRCVFSEQIDIEDTVNLSVRYSKGTLMNYMLTAHSPYEAFRMVLNGTLGRLEVQKVTGQKPEYYTEEMDYIKLYNRRGEEIKIKPCADTEGTHGGADDNIRDNLFKGYSEDSLGQMADLRAGMMSIGIGMAANISMQEKRRVYLSEFYEELK